MSSILVEFLQSLNSWPQDALFLMRVSALLGLAWLAHLVVKKGNPHWRVAIWRGTLVGLFFLPVCAWLFPPLEWETPVPIPLSSTSGLFSAPASEAARTATPRPESIAVVVPSHFWTIDQIPAKKVAQGIWCLGMILLTLRTIHGKWQIHSLIREGIQAPEDLHKLASAIGFEPKNIILLLHPKLSSPSVARWLRPVVLIPATLTETPTGWRAILAHEAAHLRRRDLIWSDLLRLVQTVLWFHPLAWRISRVHQLACEEISDAAGVEALSDAGEYASTLARLALQIPRSDDVRASFAMIERSDLGRRLDRLEAGSIAKRLSLRRLFGAGLVGITALLFAATSTWPLRGRTALYENAPAAKDLKIKAGPNTFALFAVIRNERDGTVHLGDGKGNIPAGRTLPFSKNLSRCAAWLDMVEMQLEPPPALFDILELRVFDSQNGEMFSGAGLQYQTNGIVLISSRSTLPKELDVWVRAQSYQSGDPVYHLPCQVGASVSIGAGKMVVRDLHAGSYVSYRLSKTGLIEPLGEALIGGPATSTYLIQPRSLYSFVWEGGWPGGRYQICAVRKDGTKVFPDVPHFIDYAQTSMTMFYCDVPLHEISHFEIRPFGGRHTFFFPHVKLPARIDTALSKPPSLHVNIEGNEQNKWIEAWGPAGARVKVLKGEAASGTTCNALFCRVTMKIPTEETLITESTIVYEWDGFKPREIGIQCYDLDGKPIDISSSRSASGRAESARSYTGFQCVRVPLSKLGAIDLTSD